MCVSVCVCHCVCVSTQIREAVVRSASRRSYTAVRRCASVAMAQSSRAASARRERSAQPEVRDAADAEHSAARQRPMAEAQRGEADDTDQLFQRLRDTLDQCLEGVQPETPAARFFRAMDEAMPPELFAHCRSRCRSRSPRPRALDEDRQGRPSIMIVTCAVTTILPGTTHLMWQCCNCLSVRRAHEVEICQGCHRPYCKPGRCEATRERQLAGRLCAYCAEASGGRWSQ